MNILHAIRWVAQAWEAVKKESISRKAGINFTLLSREHQDQDPFEQFDSVQSTCMKDDLEAHVHQLTEARFSVSEYINGDDDIPTCSEEDNKMWEEELLSVQTSNL